MKISLIYFIRTINPQKVYINEFAISESFTTCVYRHTHLYYHVPNEEVLF